MTRIFLALLAVAAAASAASEDPRKSPAGRAAEAYLHEASLEPMSEGADVLFSAAAQGGFVGWATLRLDVWLPSLDGEVNDSGGGLIDVASELGLDGTEVAVVPRAYLSLGGVGILVDAFAFETEGNGTLTTSVTFAGITYTVSEDVVTDLDLVNVRGFLAVPVVKTGFLQISLLGGISYADVQITIEGAISGTGTVSLQIPVPSVGVLGEAKLGPVILDLEVTGLAVSLGDYDIDYINVQASVGFVLFKMAAIRAGYRFAAVNGSVDDVDVDLTLDGFFVGASITF